MSMPHPRACARVAAPSVVAPSVVQSGAWLLPLGRCTGPVSLGASAFLTPARWLP